MVAIRGSPPRRRGKGWRVVDHHPLPGITPAQAGKRYYVDPQVGVNRDHPRAGGEKLSNSTRNRSIMGLPPHRRGKGLFYNGRIRSNGITPAQAGKSSNLLVHGVLVQDHPRVGGEKPCSFFSIKVSWGSPPRGRGKVFVHQVSPFDVGITPAWAGKCPASQPWFPPLWIMVIRPRP